MNTAAAIVNNFEQIALYMAEIGKSINRNNVRSLLKIRDFPVILVVLSAGAHYPITLEEVQQHNKAPEFHSRYPVTIGSFREVKDLSSYCRNNSYLNIPEHLLSIVLNNEVVRFVQYEKSLFLVPPENKLKTKEHYILPEYTLC